MNGLPGLQWALGPLGSSKVTQCGKRASRPLHSKQQPSGISWKHAQYTSQRRSNIYFLGFFGGGFLFKCILINIPSLTEVMINYETSGFFSQQYKTGWQIIVTYVLSGMRIWNLTALILSSVISFTLCNYLYRKPSGVGEDVLED